MKNLFILTNFVLLLGACSAEVESSLDLPSVTAPQEGQSNPVVSESFISDCQSAGSTSYQITATSNDGVFSVSQRSYLSSNSCMGNPGSSAVSENVVTAETRVEKSIDGLSVDISANDGSGPVIKASIPEAWSYDDERGLFAKYSGTAVNASSAVPISAFAQVLRDGDGVNTFTYVWTMANETDVNPTSNAWVTSSSKTSKYFQNIMKSCTNIQIITVTAGTFKTCLIERPGTKIWYGNVPVTGIVKIEKDEGIDIYEYPLDMAVIRATGSRKAAAKFELTSVGY